MQNKLFQRIFETFQKRARKKFFKLNMKHKKSHIYFSKKLVSHKKMFKTENDKSSFIVFKNLIN